MSSFIRNIQLAVVILLQIVTVFMLFVIMSKNFENKKVANINYGLKEQDLDRMINLHEKENGTEVIKRKIASSHIEKNFESGPLSIHLSDELALKVLDLINKWQQANDSEKKQIENEIEIIIEKDPKVKDLIQSLSGFFDDLEIGK